MKIYIVGIVGTGKTTLAKKLSKKFKISFYELDNIVYKKDEKNDLNTIHKNFQEIIQKDNWIIEDVMRDIFQEGLKKADIILFLDLPIHIRHLRIIKRYIKRKLKIEKSNYQNDLATLKKLFNWSIEYEKDKENRIKLLEPYQNKVIKCQNTNIKKIIKKIQTMKKK